MAEKIPPGKTIRPGYENLVAECPSCGHECIFNRASDLRTFTPIAGRNVFCLSETCGKPFRLSGDRVNERHEMLILDCQKLLEQKSYMNAILSIAIAYEIFFSLFMRVELCYKPFAGSPNADIADLNRLLNQLEEKIKKHSFVCMRALFLKHITEKRRSPSLCKAGNTIAALPDDPKDPKDKAIEAMNDPKLISFLKTLKSTSINTLRNRVVHKHAYRPCREEVETDLQEAESILFPLTHVLGLRDDFNWYINQSSRTNASYKGPNTLSYLTECSRADSYLHIYPSTMDIRDKVE